MKHNLKQFNTFCESILQEKRSSFFTKILTNQRYLEEDFEIVWEGSGLKKLYYALNVALDSAEIDENNKIPAFNAENAIDISSVKYEDLPTGTAGSENIGLRITYDIVDEYKYVLLKILSIRNNDSLDELSYFGMFNDYLLTLLNDAEQSNDYIIKTDMKLEIIATPISDKDVNYTENMKHTHFTESGFNCLIFLWFDASSFKNELLNLAKNSKSKEDRNLVQITDIDKINLNNSKIKLGTETLTLAIKSGETIKKFVKGAINLDLLTPIADLLNTKLGISKVLGLGKSENNTEKYDKVKINKSMFHSLLNLGDIANPYIYVLSKVTLDKWLYKDDYTKSASDMKDKKVNYAIQLKKPFNEQLIKIDLDSPGVLTTKLDNPDIWTAGNLIQHTAWPSDNNETINMMDYLITDETTSDKYITCRWQYYLDYTHNMYGEYRVAINLIDFYNCINKIIYNLNKFVLKCENITFEEIDNLNIKYYKDLEKGIMPNTLLTNKPFDFVYKNLVKFLNTSIDSTFDESNTIANGKHKNFYIFLDKLLNENLFLIKKADSRDLSYDNLDLANFFNEWWNTRYKLQNELGKPKSTFNLISIKHLYTNKDKALVNSISPVARSGMPSFIEADSNAALYFKNIIFDHGNKLSVNGETLNNLFYINKIQNILKDYDLASLRSAFNEIKEFNNQLIKIINTKQINNINDKRFIAQLNQLVIFTEK